MRVLDLLGIVVAYDVHGGKYLTLRNGSFYWVLLVSLAFVSRHAVNSDHPSPRHHPMESSRPRLFHVSCDDR
jgi:hypothetical protein